MQTTMKYGDYNFSPVPFMSIKVDYLNAEDGAFSKHYTINLEGTLSTGPTMDSGIQNVMDMQDSLREALVENGKRFEVKCGDTVLLACYPKVHLSEDMPTGNNWVENSTYTIELQFEDFADEDNSPYLDQVSEEWTIEFMDNPHYSLDLSGVSPQHNGHTYSDADNNPYFLSVSHNLSAHGLAHYTGTGEVGTLKQGWEYARDWVSERAGFSSSEIQESGILNIDVSSLGIYNHLRTVNKNKSNGLYNLIENWVVAASGSGNILGAIEQFNVEVTQEHDSDITNVSIHGNIEGLETRDYGDGPDDFSISKTKIEAANDYWDTIQSRVLPRAQLFGEPHCTRPLNVIPLVKTVGRNVGEGVVTFNYNFDDRPSNVISGVKSEQITIVDNNHADIVAQIGIIGRFGSILQDMNAATDTTRSINIECVTAPSTGNTASALLSASPKSQVATLLCGFETDLMSYDQLYKIEDTENWNPKTGRYSRNVTYLYQDCSPTGNTSVC